MPSPDSSFLAVYGSLRRRSLAKQGFFVLRNLRFHGHGVLRGLLFIQNGYPAVLEQPGLVRVELYRVLSETVWEILDRYEGYRHSLGCRALFYRKEVTLLRPQIRASVYFLGREVPRGSKRPCCLTQPLSIRFRGLGSRCRIPRTTALQNLVFSPGVDFRRSPLISRGRDALHRAKDLYFQA
jgi:gamma-glutamylcyclotransferase (GGCT)/AIG2-like uncharacterized protein YtfP